MCPTCHGELVVTHPELSAGHYASRCPTCQGTGDPESYDARVRGKLAELERADLEDIILTLVDSFFPDGSDGDVNGGDLVMVVGFLLEDFRPEALLQLEDAAPDREEKA